MDPAYDTLEYYRRLYAEIARAGHNDKLVIEGAGSLPGGTSGIASMGSVGLVSGQWKPCILNVEAVAYRPDGRESEIKTVLTVPAEYVRSGARVSFRPPTRRADPSIPRAVLLGEGEDKDGLVIGSVKEIDAWVNANSAMLDSVRRAGDWTTWWMASMAMLANAADLPSSQDAIEVLQQDIAATQRPRGGGTYGVRVAALNVIDVPRELAAIASVHSAALDTPVLRWPAAFRHALLGADSKKTLQLSGRFTASSRHAGVTSKASGEPLLLDDSQRLALGYVLTREPVVAVTGPPGTGKTTTMGSVLAAAMVEPLLRLKEDRPPPPFILGVAPTNAATKNIAASIASGIEIPKPGTLPSMKGRWVPATSYGWYYPSYSERRNMLTFQSGKPSMSQSDAFQAYSTSYGRMDNIDTIRSNRNFFGAGADLTRYYYAKGVTKSIILAAKHYAECAEKNIGVKTDNIVNAGDILAMANKVTRALREMVVANQEGLVKIHQSLWEVLKAPSDQTVLENLKSTITAGFWHTCKTEEDREKLKDLAEHIHFSFSMLPSPDSPAYQPEYEKVLQEVQCLLDEHLRAPSFDYAARYWEGRWLICRAEAMIEAGVAGAASTVSREKQLGKLAREKGLATAIRVEMEDLLCLAPLVVATPHTLPSIFGVEGRASDLAGIADLCLVDEAAQGTPDLMLPAYWFSKRVISLGDEKQILPIPPVTEEQCKGILNTMSRDFGRAVDVPARLRASVGNAQAMAAAASSFTDVMLSTHYRCPYDVAYYCSVRSYKGRLDIRKKTSMRAHSGRSIPPLSYIVTRGTADRPPQQRSLMNMAEANSIARWLIENRELIQEQYGRPIEEAVAILTPYALQASRLKNTIASAFQDDNSVHMNNLVIGSVNRLQGMGRPLVLLSVTAEAATDGRQMFLDASDNILNVAATRAEEGLMVVCHPSIIEMGKSAKSYTDGSPLSSFIKYVVSTGVELRPEPVPEAPGTGAKSNFEGPNF